MSPFHCNYARENLEKINKLHPWKCPARGLENWLVVLDDFFCDTTQHVNLNCMTVNLPFSLFSIYIFPKHLFYFDYKQYSILIFPFCLQMAYLLFTRDPLHLISTWFAWISHRISWNCIFFSNIFPYFRNRPWLEFPFITRHLYWTPKAKNLNRTDRKITNKISRTFL